MSDLFSADRLHGDDFSDAEIAEWFADEQRGYFEMSGGKANQRPLYEALYGLTLFRHIAARRFGSCLAIGAAGGTDVAKIAPQVDRFIVVEPTREFWRESINGTPSSYRTPDLRGALELADDSIDIATTINVLHHIPNVTDVLHEMHRVLKPGALLLLQEPSSSMGDWRRPRAGATKYERGISPEWFKRSLDTIGFDIERTTPCHFAPLLHIVSRLGLETFRSPLLTRIDLALCRLTAWNARYWRPRLLDKFAPGKISIVAKKRDRTAPGREDGSDDGMLKAAYRAARSRWRQILGTEARLRPIKHDLPLVRLGSGYGGWWFVDRPELRGATIISGGLGEDASFDQAFAARYDAKVVAVDPTPRSIAYFHTLKDDRLTLCAKALWNDVTVLRLFPPANPAHVSHSFVDVGDVGHAIEVETTTMDEFVRQYGLPPLVKFDIERAEVEVVCDMMEKSILPAQILVEYDEMQTPSRDSRLRVERAHAALTGRGYELIHGEGLNFLYLLR